jgi:hypothetical protein
MKFGPVTIFLLLVVIVMAVFTGKSYDYKYRITVAVRDHGELLTASNVVAVSEHTGKGCLAVGSCVSGPDLCGEATAVKMRNGLYLFAQTRGPKDLMPGKVDRWRSTPTFIRLSRLGLPTDYSDDAPGLKRLAAERTPVRLTVDEMPQFSVLTQFKDPSYVSGEIDPEHIPAALGDDVKLESVTLEVTDDDVTWGRIGKILPWLNWWSFAGEKWSADRWGDYARCEIVSYGLLDLFWLR